MKFYTIILISLLLFVGCGSSDESEKDETQKVELSGAVVSIEEDQNQTKQIVPDQNKTVVKEIIKLPVEQNTTIEKVSRVVTIYVHGYHMQGYKQVGVYGDISHDSVIDKFVEFTDLPTMQNYDKNDFKNVLAITPYYGDTPPSYYTEQDVADIENVTRTYGGGIPRYAMIIAKFAKHVLKESGAENLNIISSSMGSLVTRWLIEKDVENLASQQKIEKWLSIEGVIKGNYALSKDIFVDLVGNYFEKSVDTKHMSYDWINDNLSQENSHYNSIRIGQISGTDSEMDSIGLNYLLFPNFRPNDGYQLLRDTYFDNQNLTHTIFHVDHLGIKKDDGAYATVASFLESKRRVKITLMDVTVDDIHESINKYFNKNAEIVFASEIFSHEANKRWGIDDAISERVYNSGALKVHGYEDDGETKALNQVIFNDFVLVGEEDLEINMEAFEIDRSSKYNISEINSNTNTPLGEAFITVPLENGTYEIVSDDEWRGYLKVEVINN